MHPLSSFSFLLLSLSSLLTVSTALPATFQTTSDLSQPNLNATSLSNQVKVLCKEQPPGFVVLPRLQNCAAAMRALPSSPDIGFFHTAGYGDGFQLPTFEPYKDCLVLVEIVGNQVKSSWLEIGMAAMQLNEACLTNNGGNAGGITYAGAGNKIKITLKGRAR